MESPIKKNSQNIVTFKLYIITLLTARIQTFSGFSKFYGNYNNSDHGQLPLKEKMLDLSVFLTRIGTIWKLIRMLRKLFIKAQINIRKRNVLASNIIGPQVSQKVSRGLSLFIAPHAQIWWIWKKRNRAKNLKRLVKCCRNIWLHYTVKSFSNCWYKECRSLSFIAILLLLRKNLLLQLFPKNVSILS